jgi:hypothetical protein
VCSSDLVIYPKIKAEFSYELSDKCSPTKLQVKNHSIGAISYLWELDSVEITSDENPEIAVINESTSQESHRITLIAMNENGCNNDTSGKEILIYPELKAEFTTILSDNCSPVKVQVDNLSKGGNSYLWKLDYVQISTEKNPDFLINNVSTNTESHAISLIVSNSVGCNNDTTYAYLQVYPQINPVLSITENTACGSLHSILSGSENRTDSLKWKIIYPKKVETIVTGKTNPFTIEYINNGDVTDTINVNMLPLDNHGCANAVDTSLLIFPKVTADFNFELVADVGANDIFIRNSSINANTYNWYFEDGTQSQEKELIHFPNVYGDDSLYAIKLIASSEYCSDTVTKFYQLDLYSGIDEFSNWNPIVKIAYDKQSNNLILRCEGASTQLHSVKIYNYDGSLVFSSSCNEFLENGNTYLIPTIALIRSQIYIFALEINGQLINRKILIP